MQTPIEIVYQRCEPSDELRAAVTRQVDRLEQFSKCVTSCRVAISSPTTRHRHGDLYEVDICIAMPGHKDIIVSKHHDDTPELEHPLVAVKHAFDVAVRGLEDAMRELRGEVKAHMPEAHGRVAKFLAGENCGFIETPEGREVYFHRNAVRDGDFDRLTVGAQVRFVEEAGEKGAQASTVRLSSRSRTA